MINVSIPILSYFILPLCFPGNDIPFISIPCYSKTNLLTNQNALQQHVALYNYFRIFLLLPCYLSRFMSPVVFVLLKFVSRKIIESQSHLSVTLSVISLILFNQQVVGSFLHLANLCEAKMWPSVFISPFLQVYTYRHSNFIWLRLIHNMRLHDLMDSDS